MLAKGWNFLVLETLFLTSVAVKTEPITSANIETLKLANVIFRHGSRSPISSYDKDQYNNGLYWPNGLGQLTDFGKQQEYELGQYLRWRYMKFIDSDFHPSDVYAISSNLDRTIMSAELVLAGLYPISTAGSSWNQKVNWQPIPVRTIPEAIDNKLLYSAKCSRYEKIFKEYLVSPALESVNKKNEYMYKYLTEHTKINVTNILEATDIYDVLFVQDLHNLTLPMWANRYYPERLTQATEDLWANIVISEEMKRLRGGPLLGDMVLNMEQFIHNYTYRTYPNPPAKLYLYSGHDSTIAALLGSLRVFEKQIPSYSCAVMLELHQAKGPYDLPGDFYIQVFLRNDTSQPPYELLIPNCGRPCNLSTFISLYDDILIAEKSTWETECNSMSYSLAAKTFFSNIGPEKLVAIMCGILAATLVIIILTCLYRFYRNPKDDEGIFPRPGRASLDSTGLSAARGIRNSITNSNFKDA